MSLITPSGGLLFWMVLIFAVVFFILAKFGFPIITGMVARRQEHIEGALMDAAAAKERLDGIARECEDMLAATRAEQEKLLDEAKASASRIVEDAALKARAEADRIIARAGEDITRMRREALEDTKAQVAMLAVAVSEKILREKLSTDSAQQTLIERMTEEITKENEQRGNS